MNYYLSFKQYLKKNHNVKIWRLPLTIGKPCPNRLNGNDGCSFCDGSSFIAPYMLKNPDSLDEQIAAGINYYGKRQKVDWFYGYFQENTSTYGETVDYCTKFEYILSHPKIKGLIISTRPDYIDENVILGIRNVTSKFPDKEIWIELGLQSSNDNTLKRINRNHTYNEFRNACKLIKENTDYKIGVHMIIGLPGERPDSIEHGIIKVFKENDIDGLKLRILDIVPGTLMEEDYRTRPSDFFKFSNYDYITLICNVFERIPSNVVILRTLSYNPIQYVMIEDKGMTKDQILEAIRDEFKKRGTYQGFYYSQ